MSSRLQSVKRAATALLALCCLFIAASAAGARTLTIQNFKGEITVLPNGTVDVTETILAHFEGSWNGLYRTIPIEYDFHGFTYSLDLRMVSVTDDQGEKLRYETSRVTHYLKFKIYVPQAVDASRTIVLHYTVADALKFYEDHDEFYWNITGDEWDVAIRDAQAVISLPTGVTGLRATAFTGGYGSTSDDASIDIGASMVTVAMKRPLQFHEGLTIVIGWDKGFVHQPTPCQKFLRFLSNNWPLIIPVFAFFIMLWLWFTRGRDPERHAIAVQYEPPDQLTPGEVGALIDSSANMRDITATLVDLAVRGYITIEEKSESRMMGLSSHKDYSFHLKKPQTEWTGLKDHEIKLLSGMFSDGGAQEVDLESLHNTFYTKIAGIQNDLLDSLVEHGYFLHRPDNTRGAWIGIGFVTGILMVLLVSGLVKTMECAGAIFYRRRLDGLDHHHLRMVHARAHSTRQARVQKCSRLRRFSRARRRRSHPAHRKNSSSLRKISSVRNGSWSRKKVVRRLPGNLHPAALVVSRRRLRTEFLSNDVVGNLNYMSAQTASIMESAPRSTGGSGFGGGGFSGGGFGGGGGGGF